MFLPKAETMSTYSRFFGLLKQAKQQPMWPYADHSELVLEFTEGKTDSLRKLNARELGKLEERLAALIANPNASAAQRMRRKIIGILAERGAINSKGKPDMQRVYAWVQKYGYLRKELNAYTHNELPKLVTQAEAILASDLKALIANND